jgi:hypothetical protein
VPGVESAESRLALLLRPLDLGLNEWRLGSKLGVCAVGMEGEMRAALLILRLTIVEALFLPPSGWAKFNRFETPGEGRRCACVGSD